MKIKRLIAFLLCICLTLGIARVYGVHSHAKTSKIKLSKNVIALTVGSSKTLKVSNYSKKAKWSVLTGVDYISLTKQAKKSVKIKAKMAGVAVVQCKAGKKKLTCKVTVSAKKKALVFQEASWPFRNPAAIKPSTPSSSGGNKTPGASGNNNSGIDDIFYYDLDYTDDKGNLITSEAPAKSTTKANATTKAAATTEKKKSTTSSDATDDEDDIEDVYDDEEYYGEEEEDEGAIVNVSGKHPDDVSALEEIISAQRAKGVDMPGDLDAQIYEWGPEEVNARLEGINLSTMSIVGELDLSKFVALEKVDVSDNQITSLKIDKANLVSLNIANNKFTTFTLDKANKLESFKCSDNEELTSIKITNCTLLNDIVFADCDKLTSVDLSGDSAITELAVSGYGLSTLTLKDCTGITFLDCSENNLTALDLATCKAIEDINCSNNNIKTVKFSRLTSLMNIDCSYNVLTGLDLTGCTELLALDCSYNKLTGVKMVDSKDISSIVYVGNPMKFSAIKISSSVEQSEIDIEGDDTEEE